MKYTVSLRRHSVAENQNHRLDKLGLNEHIHTHYGDLLDYPSLVRITQEVQPDEIYNLGAMSHVGLVLICLHLQFKQML